MGFTVTVTNDRVGDERDFYFWGHRHLGVSDDKRFLILYCSFILVWKAIGFQ